MLQRTLPAGFIAPCLPIRSAKLPSGGQWLHEIKHDGFRMLVRRDAAGVRLFTRNGHDWTGRFPLIARAALSLKAASCLIDGEAVACDDNGLPVFDRLRYRRDDRRVFLYAFDLIELDGDDLRREPIERRKVLLIRLLAKASVGLQISLHYDCGLLTKLAASAKPCGPCFIGSTISSNRFRPECPDLSAERMVTADRARLLQAQQAPTNAANGTSLGYAERLVRRH
jgi:ATP-dependent DNA ligase